MSRGLGKWQRELLAAVEESGAIPVAWHFSEKWQRPLTNAEYKALQRAADKLAARGQVEWCYVWMQGRTGQRTAEKWLLRKDTTAKDHKLPEAKTQINKRRGEKAPSLPRGSKC